MPIPQAKITGVELPLSRLIIGCDNKDKMEDGAPVWDAWMEAGGNAFDTAHIYGGGAPEKALGQWIKARNVAGKVVITAKGAHDPNCNPKAIGTQLTESLDRLQLSSVPIYIMHRDNLNVPVGEFVTALNDEIRNGRIKVYGGSNWTIARFKQAQAFAAANKLQPPTILNNNLSLAVMEKPVWPGCLTANTAETLGFLRGGGVTHFSWSSQARGYFLPAELRDRLPEDTRPETCFGSAANAERRTRAEALAKKHGVATNSIALAWVLCQSFPSFALVGPRTVDEIKSSLPGAALKLSSAEIAWLNLEADKL
jgi:aryl-alcohol dehydrogenase-like predicted oxidoreductase